MPTGFRQPISRRGFLTVGSIGLGGLTLADLLRVQARQNKWRFMQAGRAAAGQNADPYSQGIEQHQADHDEEQTAEGGV